MDWESLSYNARSVMQELGSFSPTVHPANRQVKGWMQSEDGEDGRTYWDSEDLRNIAKACNEVANWLDARAIACTPPSPNERKEM